MLFKLLDNCNDERGLFKDFLGLFSRTWIYQLTINLENISTMSFLSNILRFSQNLEKNSHFPTNGKLFSRERKGTEEKRSGNLTE